MKFENLKKGEIYLDKDGVEAVMFVELRNDQIATFYDCEYDEKGDFVPTTKIRYLTKNEVKKFN